MRASFYQKRYRKLNVWVIQCLVMVFATIGASKANGMTPVMSSSLAAPAPVGSMVMFHAAVSDSDSPNIWYRFEVRKAGGQYQIIRDYSPNDSLDWTAWKHDGVYEMKVSARNPDTGEEANTSSLFEFQSLVTGDQPVVSSTLNSLVFLYSVKPCAAGSRMRVDFSTAGGVPVKTPFEACSRGLSMNFYLAGLLPNTTYAAHYVLDNGSAIVSGPDVTFTSGGAPADLYTDTILVPNQNNASNSVLLGGPLGAHSVANDLAGNILWYGPDGITFLTRAEAGGEFWGIVEAPGSDVSQQIIRKFDLVGMTLLETNASRVNEQLKAQGKPVISGFHHEVRSISGGRIAVLAGTEKIVTDVQGPGAVDVLGDMIVILDQDLNVIWTWNSFDNLDVNRSAPLGEICPNAGCPAFYLANKANDWTHGNAIQETSDGSLLYSARNQDWLIKLFYDGGTGDGHIIWRLGRDGDFQVNSTDPFPWFSHQHDGNFELANPSRLLVFDDGNSRVAALGSGHSRGQVYDLDEANRVATPVLSADLGVYSTAVGSAQHLRNGDYHFDAGFVAENGTIDSYSIEVDPTGAIRYEAHQNVILYRTFRMTDLYTPN